MPLNDAHKPASLHPQAKVILDRALSLYKSTHIDDALSALAFDLTTFFEAEGVRMFAHDAVDNEVYTRVKLSDTFVELRFAVSEESLAGYTALHKKVVAVDDVRHSEAFADYPGMRYDARYEDRTGVRVTSIISVPMLEEDGHLIGLIQLVNVRRPVAEYTAQLDFLVHVGKLVAAAVFHHDERQRRATKFDLLLEEGVISSEELTEAIKIARQQPEDAVLGDPVSVLLENYKIPEEDMRASLSRYYLTDFLSYEDSRIIPPELLQGYNTEYFRKNFVIPIALEEGVLTVLMDNPFNSALVRDLKATYQADRCRLFVGFRKDIVKYIESARGFTLMDDGTDPQLQAAAPEPVDSEDDSDHAEMEEEDILDENAPLVAQVVNKLILEAYESGVSDIHVEPGLGKQQTTIRYRKDGACFPHAQIPKSLSPAVINRIKVMSRLKLEEHRFPQSGKIRLKYGDKVIELRVEVTPTVGRKEDVVMRVLAGGTFLSISDLDLSEHNRKALLDVAAKPYGILLAVGPTGSGKTTTLHAILHHLNTPEKKIWTVEDPVEITQPGLRQVQVNLNIKPEPFDFAKAMRSFLRADPDIIMVGEMRDRDTAAIAVEASLTGHLVLSTLHTNSAPETITRIIEMGIDPINVADSLLGILAQRLVRVLCDACKKEYAPDAAELDTLAAACHREHLAACGLDGSVDRLFHPVGCDRCVKTGFRGRAGIHELLRGTPAVKQAITAGKTMTELRDTALADGMGTLKMDGIRRVIAGQTTLSEVLKVCID